MLKISAKRIVSLLLAVMLPSGLCDADHDRRCGRRCAAIRRNDRFRRDW